MTMSLSDNTWKTSPTQLVNARTYGMFVVGLLGCVAIMHLLHRHNDLLATVHVKLPQMLGYAVLIALVCQILLLVGCWLNTRFTIYSIKEGVLHTRQGILFRTSQQLELYRIKDYEVLEPLFLRLFGYGHMELHTSDRTDKTLRLIGLHAPQRLSIDLRMLVEDARKAKRVREID